MPGKERPRVSPRRLRVPYRLGAMEPVMTTPEERRPRPWRGRPGLVAALATVVMATAIAAVATRSPGGPGETVPGPVDGGWAARLRRRGYPA